MLLLSLQALVWLVADSALVIRALLGVEIGWQSPPRGVGRLVAPPLVWLLAHPGFAARWFGVPPESATPRELRRDVEPGTHRSVQPADAASARGPARA